MTDDSGQRLPLLSRMASDVGDRGSLRRSTAVLMWVAYAAHAGAVAGALARPDERLPVPEAAARTLGPVAVAAGTALSVSGMSTFQSVGEVEGTRHDQLATGGVYQHSRNPQYVGYIVLLSGAALWRRSVTAALLTVAAAACYAAWIPVEEEQLCRRYGQPYRDYLARVGRWWGRRH